MISYINLMRETLSNPFNFIKNHFNLSTLQKKVGVCALGVLLIYGAYQCYKHFTAKKASGLSNEDKIYQVGLDVLKKKKSTQDISQDELSSDGDSISDESSNSTSSHSEDYSSNEDQNKTKIQLQNVIAEIQKWDKTTDLTIHFQDSMYKANPYSLLKQSLEHAINLEKITLKMQTRDCFSESLKPIFSSLEKLPNLTTIFIDFGAVVDERDLTDLAQFIIKKKNNDLLKPLTVEIVSRQAFIDGCQQFFEKLATSHLKGIVNVNWQAENGNKVFLLNYTKDDAFLITKSVSLITQSNPLFKIQFNFFDRLASNG